MAITYPVSLPAAPRPSSVVVKPLSASALIRAPHSFRQQVQKFDGKLWQVEVDVPLVKAADAGEWRAFVAIMNDGDGTVLLGDSGAETPLGVASGAPSVDGAHAAGAETVNTTGWTANVAGILEAGDYAQVGAGTTTRLYIVKEKATSDASGKAALTIWPPLREALSGGETVVTQAPKGTFRLASRENAWAVRPPNLYDFSFIAIEAVDG